MVFAGTAAPWLLTVPVEHAKADKHDGEAEDGK
jgi:hypothetical protein